MGDVVQAAPKKIIICCDGTFQSSVTGEHNLPSNVTRLARTIAKAGKETDGKVWQQVVFYDAGIGTGSLSSLETKRQGATGDGLVVNVIEAYNFVVNNYSPGDKIYCFGFSRGAFTARAVAGMITDFGVIKAEQMQHFPSLFAAYKTNTAKHNFRKTKEFFEWYAGKIPMVPESKQETETVMIPWYEMGNGDIEHPNSRGIEVVGVFDTVGSLGLGDTYLQNNASSRQVYEWLNVKWSPYIKHAFHAIALDERRQPFLPSLYYIPFDKVVKAEDELLKKDEVDWPELTEHRKTIDAELQEQKADHKPDLVQVWFTGVHINVGGGKDDAKIDFEGLANITFAWMVEQCRPYLAFEEATNGTISDYLFTIVEDDEREEIRKGEQPSGIIGTATATVVADLNATKDWITSHLPGAHAEPKEKMVRAKSVSANAFPTIQPDHWAVFRASDSYTLFYKAISAPVHRSPGAAKDMSAETHIPFVDLGETNEWIHPSVQWRSTVKLTTDGGNGKEEPYLYKSEALDGFQYTQKDGVHGWLKDTIWLPEWPVVAALEDVDPDPFIEATNSELALIDRCSDKEEVRTFLKDHALDWQKSPSKRSLGS